MSNGNNPDNQEKIEKLKLERFKVWGKIITVSVPVVFGSVLAAILNYQIQTRQLEQQRSLNETELELQGKKEAAELKLQEAKAVADQRQAEMKYLGDFVELALTDDHTKRLRFAEYFAKLTISKELREKWEKYHEGILDTIKLLEAKKIELFKTGLGEEEKKKIAEEVIQLKAQLAPLPEKSELDLKKEKAGLDDSWRPLKYTKNEYELQSDGKVVFDKATGLMWQQSGSDEEITFEEAKICINKLNREKFAGYGDWRLPTLKEAISLLERERNDTNDLYINPIFDKKQRWIWTSDLYSASSAWVVIFYGGSCYYFEFSGGLNSSVRAVR